MEIISLSLSNLDAAKPLVQLLEVAKVKCYSLYATLLSIVGIGGFE